MKKKDFIVYFKGDIRTYTVDEYTARKEAYEKLMGMGCEFAITGVEED